MEQNGSFVVEPERRIEIAEEADVVVTGGGPSGVCAAIAAARAGARTVLIERMGFLGGSATAAMVAMLVGYFRGEEEQVVGGIGYELAQRVVRVGGSPGFFRQVLGASTSTPIPLYSFPFDPEILKKVLDDMVSEAGVRVWLHTQVADPWLAGRSVKGVIVQGLFDRRAIAAKVVIEAGADGLMARKMGAPMQNADQDTRARQPMSLMMRLGGVQAEVYRALPVAEKQRIVQRGVESGALPSRVLGLVSAPNPGEAFVLTTRISGRDGAEELDLTLAEMEGRRQVFSILEYLRREVPGFRDAYLTALAPRIGIRETWRILGEYVLTQEDVLSGRQFEDAIAQSGGPMDIHHAKGEGITLHHLQKPVGIPYRCLLPREVDGLIVTGRCASATAEAMGALRGMPLVMATGHAAGAAAALAVRDGVPPRHVDVPRLRELLQQQQAIIDPPSLMERATDLLPA